MALASVARIELSHINGQQEDAVVLQFALSHPNAFLSGADVTVVKTACENFLNFEHNVPSSASNFAVGEWIGKSMSRAAAPLFSLYTFDLNDSSGLNGQPLLGAPQSMSNMALLIAPDSASPGLPQEVALCLSYRADIVGVLEETSDGADPGTARDRPRSRRRGRTYIGPLTTTTISVSDDNTRPKVEVRETLTMAAAKFAADLNAASVNIDWGVWSRVDRLVRPVTLAWVDDAFDTQRRRGLAASTRLEVAV